ncbi:alcohol dehydrogenase catalytic domain-containing protein [Erythrobacter longus]|uniref:alcohol dehydrogenase catalytic domain-containing protein n=1 Tax=Erythrobacter longus TaxID=1044 RepID=UPI00055610AB
MLSRDVTAQTMEAMQFSQVGKPLAFVEKPLPVPVDGEILIEVAACGVCRTDLHIIDGDIEDCLPIVPGHEVVGRVVGKGEKVKIACR